MTDTANRVLSLEEVLALPHETQVWVQYKSLERISMVQTVKRFDGYVDLAYGKNKTWVPAWFPERYGVEYRVWSLPQPPTPQEIAANPWRKEGEASE